MVLIVNIENYPINYWECAKTLYLLDSVMVVTTKNSINALFLCLAHPANLRGAGFL